ncbi:MAG: hypothetical protein R3E86_12535 [Pseudomonadales bacterium]
MGVELLLAPGLEGLQKGSPIDLELVISGQSSEFEGLVVDQVQRSHDIALVGVRLSRKLPSSLPGAERRSSNRWLTSDEFLPTCMAPTPGKFDDFIYLQVRDISPEGLQLTCSLRNKFLIPGMRLDLTAVFPMSDVARIEVEIVRVTIASFGGRDKLVVGTRFRSLSDYTRSVLGQYIVQFGNLEDLNDLKNAGLVPRHFSYGVDFYYLKSEDDYKRVLDLRYIAHKKDGNLLTDCGPEALADINDARSRIVVGRYRGEIVATARVRFNEATEPMEHEAYVEWPKGLPRRDQIIEISRLATDPRFRRNDLLMGLFRFLYLSIAQKDRPWVLISCLDQMVPFYEKIGFQSTGLRHTEPLWKHDRVLNVMILNMFEMIVGRRVGPLVWNVMWNDVERYLEQQSVIVPVGIDRIRVMIYRMLTPLGGVANLYARLSRFWRSRAARQV